MAPVAPVPSARPGTQAQVFPPAQRMVPLDNVCHKLPPPVLAAIFVVGGPYIGTHLHVCTFMTSKLHDTMRGKPFSPLSSLPLFPSASSPPVGPRWSLPFCGLPCPALRALSRPFAGSSRRPSVFPLCPGPPVARCTTLYHIPSPRCGFASIRAALAVPPPPLPSRRFSICMSPHLGLPQCSSVLDRDTARKLHAMLHYHLLPRSLSPSLSPGLLCAYGWAPLWSLPLSRARYTTMCRAPSLPRAPAPLAVARTVHGNPLCSLAPLSVAFWPLLCPCLVPSPSLPSLARPVSSFLLMLCPTPSLCAPPPSEHDARHSPVLGYARPHAVACAVYTVACPAFCPRCTWPRQTRACPPVTRPSLICHSSYHAPDQVTGMVRMMHDMLRSILPFGPCTLPRSLFWLLALRVICAPWPLAVCPLSPAHGTQHCAGHPLPSPCPCVPSPSPVGRFRVLPCSLPLYAHCAEHPHPLASLPFVVCSLGVPWFPLLSPVPGPCYPSPAPDTLQASCTHVSLHPPVAFPSTSYPAGSYGPWPSGAPRLPCLPLPPLPFSPPDTMHDTVLAFCAHVAGTHLTFTVGGQTERLHAVAARRCHSPRKSRRRGQPHHMPRGRGPDRPQLPPGQGFTLPPAAPRRRGGSITKTCKS